MVPNTKHALDHYTDRRRRFLLRFEADQNDWARLRKEKLNAKARLQAAAKALFEQCRALLSSEPKWKKYPTVKAALAAKDSAMKDLKGVFDSRLRTYVVAKTKHWEAMKQMTKWVVEWRAFVKELNADAEKFRAPEDRKVWLAAVKNCADLDDDFRDFFDAVTKGAKSDKPNEDAIEAKYLNQKFGRMDIVVIDEDEI